MKKILLLSIILSISLYKTIAGTVTLTWDPSTNIEVTSYNIYSYHGDTNSFSYVFNTNNLIQFSDTNIVLAASIPVPETIVKISNLASGNWLFTASAIATQTNSTSIKIEESDISNIVNTNFLNRPMPPQALNVIKVTIP